MKMGKELWVNKKSEITSIFILFRVTNNHLRFYPAIRTKLESANFSEQVDDLTDEHMSTPIDDLVSPLLRLIFVVYRYKYFLISMIHKHHKPE